MMQRIKKKFKRFPGTSRIKTFIGHAARRVGRRKKRPTETEVLLLRSIIPEKDLIKIEDQDAGKGSIKHPEKISWLHEGKILQLWKRTDRMTGIYLGDGKVRIIHRTHRPPHQIYELTDGKKIESLSAFIEIAGINIREGRP